MLVLGSQWYKANIFQTIKIASQNKFFSNFNLIDQLISKPIDTLSFCGSFFIPSQYSSLNNGLLYNFEMPVACKSCLSEFWLFYFVCFVFAGANFCYGTLFAVFEGRLFSHD